MPDYRTKEWRAYFEGNGIDMPDDNVVEFPNPENHDTDEESYIEEAGSTGNPDPVMFVDAVVAARELEVHDWQAAINAITRRRSVLEQASKTGRVSERALCIMELDSLAKVGGILREFMEAKRNG